MKIIVLAAGKGERLMPLTRNTPKPLLDMGNGKTLLEEQIERIQDSGVIDEIVLVIGYLAEQIDAKIRMHINDGVRIKTIYNPLYEVSNNLISLWLAKPEMNDDFMITNGDNLFTPDVFSGLISENGDGIYLSINKKDKYDDDDMKVKLQGDLVSRVSKLIAKDEADAESPGLVLVRGENYRSHFTEYLELIVREREHINSFWLEVFNFMHTKGIPVRTWEFDGNTKWQEVDFHIDVDKAKELLKLR